MTHPTTPEAEAKEREAFEEWYAETESNLEGVFGRTEFGSYWSSKTQLAWQAWLARSLASPQVPVEAIHYAISQIVANQNNLQSLIPTAYAHSNHENMAVKHIAALKALLPEEKA